METLKFAKWPFESGERVTVHWIRSPYRAINGEWVIDIVFKRENGQIDKKATIPFGAIPWLRHGQYVIDRVPMKKLAVGEIISINLKNIQKGYFSKAINVLRKSFYPLIAPKNFNEYMWCIHTNYKTVVIPCIEILRAFLVPSRFLANAILNPTGLNSLVEFANYQGDQLHIKFSNEIPKSYINKSLVNHIIWLLYNDNARSQWTNLYNSFYTTGIKTNPFNPINEQYNRNYVKIALPLDNDSDLQVRVLEDSNTILVLDILSSTGLTHPFKDLNIEHDGFVINSNNTKGTSRSGDLNRPIRNGDNVLDQSLQSSFYTNLKPQIDITSTRLIFNNRPDVKIIESKQKTSLNSKGKEIKETEDQPNELSAIDSISGGRKKPLEFRPIEIDFNIEDTGLEDFLKAIELLQSLFMIEVISINFDEVPGNKGISFVTENIRRKFVCVLLRDKNGSESLVIELGRPDMFSISTLFIKPKEKDCFSTFERNNSINKAIDLLLDNNGSWDKERLKTDNFNYYRFLKHYKKDTSKSWAYKIVGKLE